MSQSNESAAAAPGRPLRKELVAMTVLGVDWGQRRIGLAIKPAGQDWPLPRRTLTVKDEARAIEALRHEIKANGAQAVVVGLPEHPDPTQAAEIKRFCRKTRQGMSGVRWFFVDERLTTQRADELSLELPGHKPTDDLAAALILDSFIMSCPVN